MSNNKISATIHEINEGPYYEVLLYSIPKVGEYINLYSHLDNSSGHDATHNYEVINIVHEVHDIATKVESSKDGYHSVRIFVRRSSNNAS